MAVAAPVAARHGDHGGYGSHGAHGGRYYHGRSAKLARHDT